MTYRGFAALLLFFMQYIFFLQTTSKACGLQKENVLHEK